MNRRTKHLQGVKRAAQILELHAKLVVPILCVVLAARKLLHLQSWVFQIQISGSLRFRILEDVWASGSHKICLELLVLTYTSSSKLQGKGDEERSTLGKPCAHQI